MATKATKTSTKRRPPKNGKESVAEVVATEVEVVVPEVPAVTYKYREFKPEALPQEYRYMTPDWLYQSLVWDDRVRELRPNPSSDLRNKLQIGATVAVLILFGVIIFLAMAIVAG